MTFDPGITPDMLAEYYPIEPSKRTRPAKQPLSNAARAAIRRKAKQLDQKLTGDEQARRRAAAYQDPDPWSERR